ncbi:nucleoside hydrolase, partial [Brachybacterium sp.]|uniref:nucleoside hydrolase n=1 Tax=Brachybacterium sp. TaxID=1891286 RepID=UPI002ED2E94B
MASLPLLVDFDPGIDDAIALSYLAAHPDVEVAGLIATGGNVEVGLVHRNALVLAESLGLDAPIARGAEHPLVQEAMYADDTHGPGGLGHASV